MVLADANATKSCEYIYSMCFSPNGENLATGGLDHLIRVRLFPLLFGRYSWRALGLGCHHEPHPKHL
jgi:WD40 repeat protein